MTETDIIVVGGGPAGLSAVISARQRDSSVTVISNDRSKSGLYRARLIDNYPGLPGITGAELLDRLFTHASAAGANMITGQVSAILPSENTFHVGYGSEFLTSKSVILAIGIAQKSLFPGEEALLGYGVSYCATCDGMLYRGKRVCVVCLTSEADAEADYLASIGCDVIRIKSRKVEIIGEQKVTAVIADGEFITCDGVFILRDSVAPHLLLPGLETKNGLILADSSGKTNIPGVYAAGDCVSTPYQVAKAVGQGFVAALSASEYVKNMGIHKN